MEEDDDNEFYDSIRSKLTTIVSQFFSNAQEILKEIIDSGTV